MLKFLTDFFWGDAYNTRIEVSFINHDDNSIIDVLDFPQEYLPEYFSTPMSLIIDQNEWIIVRANPAHANDYSFDKKLTLWLKNPKELNFSQTIHHPSASNIQFGINGPKLRPVWGERDIR